MLDDWAWVQVILGYARDHKIIQVFCVRDRGTYQDHSNRTAVQGSPPRWPGGQPGPGTRDPCASSSPTCMIEADITWKKDTILTDGFWNDQEHCNGIVQIDRQGFFSPKGELVVVSVSEE